MIIGIVQMDIEWEDIYRNMNKIEGFVKEACEKKIELLLFPEMSLTGFTMDIDKHTFSEKEISNWISKIAVRYSMNIGIGFGVIVDEKGLNKYMIVSNEGNIIADYSKIHPFSYGGEDKKYYKGNDIIDCSLKDINITPFICYDLRFPEIFQIASKKSELICVAANWPGKRENHWITLLIARAIENQCYIAGINRVGTGDGIYYNGASMIIDPEGNVLNEITSDEGIITADICKEKVLNIRKSFSLKKDRREKLYRIY
ncbi:carbon-nitrogen family hydrolase [Clostridium butyricum]|uniref:Nitrilase/cyanide hydratase and apolipoprotein N-acyltransferase n=1 Tax=Clostridium butyricum E4 str. BoNT E BL5262 TaxID=632245 RepID=C4ID08_CLOBU|nr:carbon-nitrogen family hydrolase [Clostridium butyricum]APF24054.1 carbon-nitrogen hydrolase family protein [Clostridium butyricum]EDT75538.1 nitrilase/cyanide hydratase and apolipoprotein N-acyltransferase [Clostridium butyricum 5521]EEP55859.1 nitrilase/cyanide hydratase and apolipoprotein N-acyltransferase [Clostridium butyricum E4 str. BoNT E BL5262]NFL31319.1 carbon-nitrogen family hydrolase [Clostridium butyricum]NFS18360.1 carbon-nitrogen family hydrolase [Clostridium butyricum]